MTKVYDLVEETQHSMAEMPDPIPGGSGRKSRETGVGASSVTTRGGNDCLESERLMEAVVERSAGESAALHIYL